MSSTQSPVSFSIGEAAITVDLAAGARLASLRVGGLELLRTRGEIPIHWGCYPMAPWTGRMRHGRFSFDGETYQMPLTMPPHAIHGTTYTRTWRQMGREPVFETTLGEDWPFSGRVRQRYDLREDGLDLTLEVISETDPFPAACGWHPWFPRRLARGGEAELHFEAGAMYHRDADFLMDGTLVPPKPPPWDDCFSEVAQPVSIVWPDAITLEITSDLPCWVVYSERDDAICIEPQTGPPNAFTVNKTLVRPGEPLTARARFRWQ